MGTIVIEEYARAGGAAQQDKPVYRLDTLLARTVDSTTSTTAESITLNQNTNFVRVYTEEIHRLSPGADNTASIYATTEAQKWTDFGVQGGEPIFYRTDA